MKLKLSNSQMAVFAETVSAVCIRFSQVADLNMEQKLYKQHFDRLNIDLQIKLVQYKTTYKQTLQPEQAIAYWIVISNTNLGNNLFAVNFNRGLCDQIHKQFS